MPIYHYPVVGRNATGGVFDRLPIVTMQEREPRQFALFIRAFLRIQGRLGALQVAEPAASSFKEIAAIHGKPYIEWAGDRNHPQDALADYRADDKKDTDPVPSRFGGYCNHGSVVFPTWHRPYMLLIEQAIGNVAVQLANDIEANGLDQDGVWVKAAKELRFPYWDWAEKDVERDGLPSVLVDNWVEIVTPEGEPRETVDNPLSFFPYAGQIPLGFTDETNSKTEETAYFSKWRRSYRYAASDENPGDSQTTLLQEKFKEGAADLRRRVAKLFTFNDDLNPAIAWDEFSNHTAESKREMDFVNADSIEGVHDTFHLLVGGNGHMADPDYAGFDPIFYLHHANVDRLLALWEWCYTEYWMGDGYKHENDEHENVEYRWTQDRGTYAQVYNQQLLPEGPLQPFRTEDGDYWTSTQARSLDAEAHHPKYYSYPEIAGVKVDKAAASSGERALGRKNIASYYGFDPEADAAASVMEEASVTASTMSLASVTVSAMSLASVTASTMPLASATASATALAQSATSLWRNLPVPATKDAPVPDNHVVIPDYRIFAVHVKLSEHAYNRSYSFQLRYKRPYSDPPSSPQLIGTISVFARPDHSPCKECAKRRQTRSVIRGMIPIPPELIDEIIRTYAGGPAKFDDMLANVKGKFLGSLVDAHGLELAKAEGGKDAQKVPPRDATSSRVTPAEISLVSTAVAVHKERKDRPAYIFDWQHHAGIFDAGWQATRDESRLSK